MGLEYSNTHQCVQCGGTYSTKYLKLARRIDDVLGFNETVFVCIDTRGCTKMKLEREQLFKRKGMKAFVPNDAAAPLKPPKPVKRTKKTLQFFPALVSPRSHRARRAWAKKLKRLNWGDPLNGRDKAKRASVPPKEKP